jgi:hypothetical protein
LRAKQRGDYQEPYKISADGASGFCLRLQKTTVTNQRKVNENP